MDYKEYSRLRSIARKRIERASKAGRTEYAFIPTVKEVKQSANPEAYLEAVKRYLSDVPSLRSAPKQQIPKFKEPGPKKKEKKPLTEAQRARKNERNRYSKSKRAIEKAAKDEKNARHRALYWKGANVLIEKWMAAGVEDVAPWVHSMSPAKAKAFMDYVEYRLSQGDYKTQYTIDTFVRDFGEMLKKGYSLKDIQGDFDKFLLKQKGLKKRKKDTNKYGLTSKKADELWRKYVGRE